MVDGGVVTGPAGASVLVTPIAAGGAPCPTGGVRVTQLADGGISNVCNGAVGPQGPAGFSLSATALPALSAQCATGGVLVGLPDGGALPVCNGAQGVAGPQGLTGATGAEGPRGLTGATGAAGPAGPAGAPGAQGLTGATGATGPAGPAGPSGPAGAVLYLDGGVVLAPGASMEFAGFTATLYTGALGGYPGANAKCAAEFPGAHFCTMADFDDANPTVAPGGSGAWVDYNRSTTSGQRDHTSCQVSGAWNWGNTGASGRSMNPVGYPTSAVCNEQKPLACCRQVSRVVFRGYTSMTYTGLLGGYPGANAKCAAQFAGSFFCTMAEYDLANPTSAPGGAGAWVDYNRSATSTQRDHTSCQVSGAWNWGSTGASGRSMNPVGYPTSAACNEVKPLACCGRR